ncbi:MAG TPA: PQQ-binding-like beta-propeller repeat protein [Azospirillaceae bacterium]|nr:PQQ-binding-like beta-propeller repeat protein [Azospirillaceae bacterium]
MTRTPRTPRSTIVAGLSRGLRLTTGIAACLVLAGCGIADWFDSEDNGPRLAGNRISVLQLEQQLETDPQLQGQPVQLPEPVANADWTQPGGNATHNPGHLALPATVREVWRAGIEGNQTEARLLTTPVVAEGRVYVLDTDFDLHAFDAASGARIWRVSVQREGQDDTALGGGVSFGEGRLFVTTGFGETIAVNPANGEVIWRQRIAAPIRTAPVVSGGRVFVTTLDNQMIVLAAENRVLQWTHSGILEATALLGGAAGAVENDVVVAPYSSGELFALRVENGRPAWSDNLAAVRRGANLSGLADIRGMPVIDNGLVFAVSHSGRMAAIDLRTGQRVWEQDVGGIQTPWVAGNWIFAVTNDAQLVAMTRDAGRVRWITQLERYEDPEDRDDPVTWSGPVLAGGRLVLVSDKGEMIEVSPETGEISSRRELPDGSSLPPVVAGGTLYVLTDDGDLVAYR